MPLENLERCVINALRELSTAALNALRTTLESFILLLEAELAALIAQAIPLQIAKQALEAQAALVSAASDALKNVSNLLPTGEVRGPCIQLSLINLNVADRLAPVTDTLDELETSILVAASLLDLNAIARRTTQELIDTLNDLIDGINEIINEKAIAAAST